MNRLREIVVKMEKEMGLLQDRVGVCENRLEAVRMDVSGSCEEVRKIGEYVGRVRSASRELIIKVKNEVESRERLEWDLRNRVQVVRN